MATTKSYADIEQSKKLAKILPIESADMFLALNGTLPVMSKYIDEGFVTADDTAIPCWSLAALLSVLPNVICLDTHYTSLNIYPTENLGWIIEYSNVTGIIDFSFNNKNLIDACYEMIIKLHEIKML